MVTLAPELPGALELIRALSGRGVVMAVGHSEADGDQLQAATGAGLRHITHLWSGQGSLTRRGPWRVPGLLEESLASEGLTAEVIADGRHLPAALLTIARRCLPGRLIVVSDASCGTGLPEGSRYTLGTVQCEVRDGVGVVEGEGSFGGSVTPLNQMVRHLVCDLGWPVDEVVHMTTRIPAAILGLAHRTGAITPGLDADLAVFDENFNAVSTMIGGRWLHHKTR
jgi:N-acetylglucosamine-6-phosphate deacetylase